MADGTRVAPSFYLFAVHFLSKVPVLSLVVATHSSYYWRREEPRIQDRAGVLLTPMLLDLCLSACLHIKHGHLTAEEETRWLNRVKQLAGRTWKALLATLRGLLDKESVRRRFCHSEPTKVVVVVFVA
jgi:hypothetical protein